ncbi:MAG: hypothetical protein LBS17_05160 [Actinomycetes bacterium]|jgi:hypothetical protein|nr:hypothetical protein [Actinomycetes bacterium]
MQATTETTRKAKQLYVNELVGGTDIDELFALTHAELRAGERSGTYALMTLADCTGTVRAIRFDVGRDRLPAAGSVLRVVGRVEGTRTARRIKVKSLRPVADYDPRDFIAHTERQLPEMQAEFVSLVKSVGDLHLRRLINAVFHRGNVWARFCVAPAGVADAADTADKGGSAARIGAALATTLRVGRLVEAVAENQTGIDRDLLVTAACLHLVGCVDAFQLTGVVSATPAAAALPISQLSLYRLHEASSALSPERRAQLEAVVHSGDAAGRTGPHTKQTIAVGEAQLFAACVQIDTLADTMGEQSHREKGFYHVARAAAC